MKKLIEFFLLRAGYVRDTELQSTQEALRNEQQFREVEVRALCHQVIALRQENVMLTEMNEQYTSYLAGFKKAAA